MLSLLSRYAVIVAVFMHYLLCGNVPCCAKTCPYQDVEPSVSLHLPPSCPCHSEKWNINRNINANWNVSTNWNINTAGDDLEWPTSDHDCGHHLHFCQCLQSVSPNNGPASREVSSKNPPSLPIAYLTLASPSTDLKHRAPKRIGVSSAPGVRLHLLLEHFLI